tara:strand:+ start:255 stop:524 length:270 start_codon:yes stop_codon:yes gene_type:complete
MFTRNELETILYTIEGYIQGNDDDKLCDELCTICDKIIEELSPVDINVPDKFIESKVIITDEYADKVDTLVASMGSFDDNEDTHDSEGC